MTEGPRSELMAALAARKAELTEQLRKVDRAIEVVKAHPFLSEICPTIDEALRR